MNRFAIHKDPLALAIAVLLAGAAIAPQAHAAAAAADAANGEVTEVIVFGRGETRQVTQLTVSDLTQIAPGTSPIKAIEKLPGVNFQSADPFGAYEWSTRITIRGFNQTQLGYTLDGLPLGDMSYGNHNGMHISRAISSENLGNVTLSQGTGALGTASTNNLGGTLQFRWRSRVVSRIRVAYLRVLRPVTSVMVCAATSRSPTKRLTSGRVSASSPKSS